jgi:histidine triad (HIT) family protein
MARDPDCVFCKIVAGEIPSFKLYEDGETLAFMDINPVHDGHCLVIPKEHYPTVFEVAPDAFAAAARTAIKVANAVNAATKPDGLNLIQSNGPAPPSPCSIFISTCCRGA